MTDRIRAEKLLETESDYVHMESVVRSMLIEQDVFRESEFWRKVDRVERVDYTIGAKLVAQAWKDDGFRKLLIDDPKQAAWELLGIQLPEHPEVTVLENRKDIHHVVVCTLCSCYPKAVLGLPPSWYKSFSYRSRMVVEPRSMLAKFGTVLANSTEIRVVDSTADRRYMVLPLAPDDIGDLSEDQALDRVSRDMMIGVRIA